MAGTAELVMGIGSPIVDLVAEVGDDFITSIAGGKGGMELVDTAAMLELLTSLDSTPVKAPGGSAANTTFALARLGMPCTFLGKLGDDEDGRFYRDFVKSVGGNDSRFKVAPDEPTAKCLSLVTPDSERTMRTNLGAAMHLMPEEITAADFTGCRHAHIEGYLLFNPDLLMASLKAAKAAGVTVSLDLGSFEVVRAAQEILPAILRDYIDIVFANEEEAESFSGSSDPETGLRALAECCEVAAVKLGKDGAMVTAGGETVTVSSVPVEKVVDTTGAGDFWAAGYLYGHLNGYGPEESGMMGSLLGGAVVQQFGVTLPDGEWDALMEKITSIRT